jgi:hypothetical protein
MISCTHESTVPRPFGAAPSPISEGVEHESLSRIGCLASIVISVVLSVVLTVILNLII